MSTFPTNSPFKLLQPYDKGDTGIFRGRETEARQMTELLLRGKFLLVYGASGTGKTSIIQCGLPGMFSPRDWLPILVRRDTNFIDSLREQILEQYRRRYALRYPGREPDIPDNLPLRDAVKRLFKIAYVPVYLILDQFEEIFTLGDEAEQQAFFQALGDLRLFEEDLYCKILIVTREEYIAHFYRYEKTLPFLFDYRYRVEKMREEQLLSAVEGTLSFAYPGHPRFEMEAGMPRRILLNLTDERGEVDLTTLQVYLDRLYREDCARAVRENDPRDFLKFDQALAGTHKLTDVLSGFLDEQLLRVDRKLTAGPARADTGGSGLSVLFKLVTSQGTKQNRSAAEIQDELAAGRAGLDGALLRGYLDELAGPDSRILNRLRFAKTGEERFEIAHDRLAEVVFTKFNAAEIRQREALTTIRNKKKRFDEAGDKKAQAEEYLSLGELELVGQSLAVDRLNRAERDFFGESRQHHVKKRQRDRRIAVGSAIAAAVFLVVAGVAFLFFRRAESAQRSAEANLRRFYEARYVEMVKKGENYVALKSPAFALNEYEAAQRFWRDTLFVRDPRADTLGPIIERIRETGREPSK